MKDDVVQKWRARGPLIVGFATVALLGGVLGAWSVGTEIAGAVIASGEVRVENERQVVQHPDGGVVGDILARDGTFVSEGDVLLRFDGTFLLSELAIVERQLFETSVRRARLSAERDDLEKPEYLAPTEFSSLNDTWVSEQIDGQTRLFNARRTSQKQALDQLDERGNQVRQQIVGLEAQLQALRSQNEIVGTELADLEDLYERGLIPIARVLELRKDTVSLDGEIGRILSSIAEAQSEITGFEIEANAMTERRREDAISELRDLRFSEIELEERRLSLSERLSRLDVRAPVSGTVFESTIFGPQAVVQPADTIMSIVPGDQPYQIHARLEPTDVDQVYGGQAVVLKFTSFDQRRTPDIVGTILRVSADVAVDRNTGAKYYQAIIEPDAGELARVEGIELLPGLPVEAFIQTSPRTPLSYLTQPLTIYFDRAFREG